MTVRNSNFESGSFRPPFWLRSALVQTVIASQKFRKRGAHAMESMADSIVFTGAGDVRLQGSYSRHEDNKALVIFLHGWEGSENSTYVMSCARQLYDLGCSVFRLNFRDHGDTHHLNEAPFHSARLDEVFEAVVEAAKLSSGAKVYLAGFSLGGNFALRIAREMIIRPEMTLEHIFAISPVIDPDKASPKVDENPLVQRYFYKKWTTSLRKKQDAFPDVYDFSEMHNHKTVLGMTTAFLPLYTDFESMSDYFNAYKIGADDLTACETPLSLIMAKDDPVIPAEDMLTLSLNPSARSIMHEHGGHNGFFESLNGPTWYDRYIQSVIFAET